MLNNPLVSICIPAYNAAKYINAAIQSIINQTYINWELIIVNDGSTDDTGTVAQNFTDKRIKILHQENKGQCAAANKAFQLSKGEFIKFFDADDILSPTFIEAQVIKLSNREHCVASAQWGRFYNDDINTFSLNPELVWKDMPADEWLIQSWRNAHPMMQCALWLIPRSIVTVAQLWDEELSLINDFDFITRILINSRMVIFCPDATLYYRSGIESSLSGTKTLKGFQSAYTAIEKATTALLQKRNDAESQLSCANIWQLFIYDTYPFCPDLIKKAEKKLSLLVRPPLKFPAGGISERLLPLLGWKLIKRLQLLKKRF